jgi:hypothetical protein
MAYLSFYCQKKITVEEISSDGLLGEKLEMKGETWMHTETPHNPDLSMEERCAFYKGELDQLEAGLSRLKIAEATRLHAVSDVRT